MQSFCICDLDRSPQFATFIAPEISVWRVGGDLLTEILCSDEAEP
jgi:hypothetical protein